MRLSLIITLTMLYIVGMMISNTCEQQTLLGTTEGTLLSGLLTPPITDWSNLFSAAGSSISIPLHYIILMFNITTFNFAIFYGTFAPVRFLFCAIGVGAVIGWITILRGVNSN